MKNNGVFLKLDKVKIGYDEALIDGVSTSLQLGEVCLLIGNNGVGKTTLIKSLLNQIPLLGGQLFWNNIDSQTLSGKEIAEQTAVVFSKSIVPTNYTLRDLISFGKYIHYPYYFELNKEDEKEIEGIIEQLQLRPYADFPLTKLSDGNLQKAFIGRALAQNSPMIILDEPTTHLDEKNKIIILKLLRELAKKQNKLILFSSHDWRLSKEFADKIWLLHNRKIHAGIAEDILLAHHELLNPQLFDINSPFIPPVILAPELQSEMLYSYLQKNFTRDLSNFQFEFSDGIWTVLHEKSQTLHRSFDEIGAFLNAH